MLARVPLVQAHDRHAGHALAGAGLADDAEGLAALDVEREAVDGLDDAVLGREVHPQVAYVEEGAARAVSAAGVSWSVSVTRSALSGR